MRLDTDSPDRQVPDRVHGRRECQQHRHPPASRIQQKLQGDGNRTDDPRSALRGEGDQQEGGACRGSPRREGRCVEDEDRPQPRRGRAHEADLERPEQVLEAAPDEQHDDAHAEGDPRT